MMKSNILPIIVILLIVGGALLYIIRAKKKGKKCIGCPYAESCASHCTKKASHNTASDKEDEKNAS